MILPIVFGSFGLLIAILWNPTLRAVLSILIFINYFQKRLNILPSRLVLLLSFIVLLFQG